MSVQHQRLKENVFPRLIKDISLIFMMKTSLLPIIHFHVRHSIDYSILSVFCEDLSGQLTFIISNYFYCLPGSIFMFRIWVTQIHWRIQPILARMRNQRLQVSPVLLVLYTKNNFGSFHNTLKYLFLILYMNKLASCSHFMKFGIFVYRISEKICFEENLNIC